MTIKKCVNHFCVIIKRLKSLQKACIKITRIFENDIWIDTQFELSDESPNKEIFCIIIPYEHEFNRDSFMNGMYLLRDKFTDFEIVTAPIVAKTIIVGNFEFKHV